MSRLFQRFKTRFSSSTLRLRSRSAMRNQSLPLLGEEDQPLLGQKRDNPPKEKRTWQTYTIAALTMMSQAPNPWAVGSIGFYY